MPPVPEAVQSGKPIQIISPTGDHSFELNHEALNALLLSDDVRRKKVCVVSVAGAFRKGKSFLLDFMLRYLTKQGSADWLGPEDQPLAGFSWRGGSKRETTGIWAWSKVFLCPGPHGEEVAVILMDTQGVFDTQSTVKESMTVFALSTMLSSVQVYNLSQNIQENDLHHLQFFIEYGKIAMGKGSCQDKPFQYLMFLIRDWSCPDEYAFGESGVAQFLGKIIHESADHPELRAVRNHIINCFKKLDCFLMPHPGLKVARNPTFDGRLADIDEEFRTHLTKLAPLLFSKEKLIVKEINGTEVTCEALLEYFKEYIKIYQGNELPQPMTVLVATTKVHNSAAVASAKELYIKGMDQLYGEGKPYLKPDAFEKQHNKHRNIAVDYFNIHKMGGGENSQEHEEQLLAEIRNRYEGYFKTTAETNNSAAAAKAKKMYIIKMNEVFGDCKKEPADFEQKHKEMEKKAFELFDTLQMGGYEHNKTHKQALQNKIENKHDKTTANFANLAAVASAEKIYTDGMDEICNEGNKKPLDFEERHNKLVEEAFRTFNKLQIGGDEHNRTHKQTLTKRIETKHDMTTAHFANFAAVASAEKIYIDGMDKVCGQNVKCIAPTAFATEYHRIKEESLGYFNGLKRGSAEQMNTSENQLIEKMRHINVTYSYINSKKYQHKEDFKDFLAITGCVLAGVGGIAGIIVAAPLVAPAASLTAFTAAISGGAVVGAAGTAGSGAAGAGIGYALAENEDEKAYKQWTDQAKNEA